MPILPPRAYKRSHSITVARLVDVDGIKVSFATPTVDTTYTGSGLNGAELLADKRFVGGLGRSAFVTLAAQVGAYDDTKAIILSGRRGSLDVTAEFTPPGNDGGVTLRNTQLFDQLTGLFVPQQLLGTGAIQVGVGDAAPPKGESFLAHRAASDGNMLVMQEGFTDVYAALAADGIVPLGFERLLHDPAPASPLVATDITVRLFW